MKIILAILFSLCISTAYSQLEIHHLTGNCYVFTTYNDFNGESFPANGMYIVTDSGAVMIDMPWDTTQVLPLLDSIRNRHGKELFWTISTHFHEDRTGAIDIFKRLGILTYSSKLTRQLCKEKGEIHRPILYLMTTLLSLRMSIAWKRITRAEGHTKDNIVIWLPKGKVLYGGCFVKSAENNRPG